MPNPRTGRGNDVPVSPAGPGAGNTPNPNVGGVPGSNPVRGIRGTRNALGSETPDRIGRMPRPGTSPTNDVGGGNQGGGSQGGGSGGGVSPNPSAGATPGFIPIGGGREIRQGRGNLGGAGVRQGFVPRDQADFRDPVFNQGTERSHSPRFSEHYGDTYITNNTTINNYYGHGDRYGRGRWFGYDDCDRWGWGGRSRWFISLNFNFGPRWHEPAWYCPPVWYCPPPPRWCYTDWWCGPVVRYRYRSSSFAFTFSSGSYVYGGPWRAATVTYWDYLPSRDPVFFDWDFWPTSAPVVQTVYVTPPAAPELVYVAPEPVFSPTPTYYRATDIGGVLGFEDEPGTLVAELRALSGDARGARAEDILGRTPAQPWSVTFEGVQERGGVRELRARAVAADSRGYRPTVILRSFPEMGRLPIGRVGRVTGRLVEVCVDDPAYPGGYLVLEDGAMQW